MANVLLVWLPYAEHDEWDFGVLGKSAKKLWTIGRPLGICYLAGAIRTAGHKVEIIDAVAQDITPALFEDYIRKNDFDLIGISGTTTAFNDVIETAGIIKKVCPSVPVMLGGPHAISMIRINQEKELFFPHSTIDFVIDGEGELTVVELLKELEKKKRNFRKIKGLIFKDGKKVVRNPPREYIKNLDIVPFPAMDLLGKGVYRRSPSSYKKQPDYPVMASRGCPFNCVFCSKIFGRGVRWRSIDNVIAEVKHLKEMGAKEIRFWDETFTVDKEFVIKLCKRMIEEKINLPWTCYGHVNTLNKELLYWMKRAGCWEVDFGIESGNDEVLKKINKGFRTEEAYRDIKRVQRMGMEARAFFMIGLPGENKETMMDTINFALKSKPDYATFYITQVYPGTQLFDMMCKEKNIKPIDLIRKIIKEKVVYYEVPDVTLEEMKELVKMAHRRFYRRPSYILGRLKKIRTLDDIKRYASAGLAVLKI